MWSSERAVSMELSVVNAVISAERLRSAIGEVARELQEHVSREQSSGRRAPLSVLQRGIWFQSQVAAPGAYVAQTALTFDRRLDAEAVVEAFRDTVTVHPAMGAEFHTDASGQPVQNLPWSGQGIDLPSRPPKGISRRSCTLIAARASISHPCRWRRQPSSPAEVTDSLATRCFLPTTWFWSMVGRVQ